MRNEVTGTTTLAIDASPDAVFAAVIDVARLPEWNDRIEQLESPATPLEVGDRWKVRMRILGKRFASVSEVLELDRSARVFSYRSKPDDDNPSHTVWTWRIATDPAGRSAVTVAWSIRPRTPGRHVMAAIRQRMIPTEVATSVGRLAGVVADANA